MVSIPNVPTPNSQGDQFGSREWEFVELSRSPDEHRRDDGKDVRARTCSTGLVQLRLPRVDPDGFQCEIGKVDHAALDGARRILTVSELVLAVPALIIA